MYQRVSVGFQLLREGGDEVVSYLCDVSEGVEVGREI